MNYATMQTTDHDQKLKFEKQDIFCYSKKQLDKLYPGGGWRAVGEVKHNNKKEAIGQLRLGNDSHKVAKIGDHNKLLYRRAGYVRVGDDNYIALLKSRVPFLIILLALLVGIALAGVLLFGGGDGPIVINPDHPLPDPDANSTPIEGDDSQKPDVEEGGGSVSMIYTLKADLSLSDGVVDIYFKNPNASSHDVAVQLYIVSGEQEYLVAESGLVKAGYALSTLTLSEDAPQLSEGVYTALYRLQCYDPISGEAALVAPEITGVELTVTQ